MFKVFRHKKLPSSKFWSKLLEISQFLIEIRPKIALMLAYLLQIENFVPETDEKGQLIGQKSI